MLKRIFEAGVTVFLLITLSFFLMKALPGSPLDGELAVDPQVQAQLEQQWGLQQSAFTQFKVYIKNILTGDLGYSTRHPEQSVLQRLIQSAQVTFQVSLLALAAALIFSFLLTLAVQVWPPLRAVYQYLIYFVVSMPALFLGLFLIWLFGIYLGWLPVALLEGPSSYILPVVVIALRPIAILSRLLLLSIQEEKSQLYVRTAKAKGLSSWQIFRYHILKNSLIPVLSYLPSLIMGILSGSLVVEIIFALPGVGSEMVLALSERDSAVVVIMTTLLGLAWILLSLLFDFIMKSVDPRLNEGSQP